MDRRDFIKNSSLLTLPLILKSCDWLESKTDYSVHVQNDAHVGHLIRESQSFEVGSNLKTETLVVGGGIAGMSAACHLKNQDFILCELSNQLGGSSSSGSFENIRYSQGAHYDLSYPANYGAEVLSFLEKLNIIQYQEWYNRWSFVDRQHIIFHRSKNQCFDHGKFRKDVIPEGKLKEDFLKELGQYENQMQMPLRLIDSKHHHLSHQSFLQYLEERLEITPEFVAWMDYHMKDDYGAGTAEISALAGIHYFKCRPYYEEIVELFSPPEGNHYFIKKMADSLSQDQLKTNQLVSRIKESPNGFDVEVIDVELKNKYVISCKNVVYAGQKHAIQYIYPEDKHLFENNQYAPWMVVNIVLTDKLPDIAYWQNEMLTEDASFMGFVDSATQQRKSKENRVLTAYYCLPQASRNDLLNVESNKAVIAEKTIGFATDYFGMSVDPFVKHVDIKVMGHAMPIPVSGYLFNDKNQLRKNKNIAYAGVDNGRLPLFFEAVDSGILAANIIQQN
ncbi:MAG: FAD-dependent oxidoreductase [Reichenbachiella sp.]